MKNIIFALFIYCISTSLYADDKLSIILDWFANPTHAPLFVAQQQGFFKEQHLQVKLIGPADPADPIKLVAAGKADIAIGYEPQFMVAVDRGLPLVALGTLIDKPLNCLAVLKSSNIVSIKDLQHKKVGYSGGSLTGITLTTMLKHHAIDPNLVERINVRYNLTQSLLSRRVDAVTGVMRTFEVLQMELAGQPARIFLPEQNGIPTYSELIFIINSKNKADLRWQRFLTAIAQANIYLHKHPEASWQKFVIIHPELNNSLNHRAWFATLPYFAHDPTRFNTNDWQHYAKFMQDHELIHAHRQNYFYH
jgi:putative hydroxymethylpyrimidine transport system substrate-binding protein